MIKLEIRRKNLKDQDLKSQKVIGCQNLENEKFYSVKLLSFFLQKN